MRGAHSRSGVEDPIREIPRKPRHGALEADAAKIVRTFCVRRVSRSGMQRTQGTKMRDCPYTLGSSLFSGPRPQVKTQLQLSLYDSLDLPLMADI